MWCFKKIGAGALMVGVSIGMLALSGCGFRPLHRTAEVRDAVPLDAIMVESIEGRKGQFLRTILTQSLTPYGTPSAPIYRLKITLHDQTSDMGILKDLTASRAQYQVTAHLVILQGTTNKKVYETNLQAAVSYNLLSDADFSTLVARENAEMAAVRELAPQIEQVVSIFLSYDGTEGAV